MGKLLKFLKSKTYDKLKEALGDDFDKLGQQYEDGEIGNDIVIEKLEELGIQLEEDVPEEETNEEDTPEEENPVEEEETPEEKEEETPEEKEEDLGEKIDKILEDGWLLEDGTVDYDKINDSTLVNFIKGLLGRLERSEWDYKYNMAIMVEAMKNNMYDTSDAERYINTDGLSMDVDGNVVGVVEAFSKLRSDKPHLFKNVVVDIDNPLDKGFNPVDKKVSGKPRSYAEAVEQTRALQK